MEYLKHEFQSGQKLYASQLNEMDEQIFQTAAEVENLKTNGIGGVIEGLVEITDGEPTKEGTVMTVDPNGEEVNLYTAEEIDAMFASFANGNEVAY